MEKNTLLDLLAAALDVYVVFSSQSGNCICAYQVSQTWSPFVTQTYINGHEWMTKLLNVKATGYQKLDDVSLNKRRIKAPGQIVLNLEPFSSGYSVTFFDKYLINRPDAFETEKVSIKPLKRM